MQPNSQTSIREAIHENIVRAVDCEGLQQQERCDSSSLHLFFAMSDEIPNCPKYKDAKEGRQRSCDDVQTFVDYFPKNRVKGVCVVVHAALAMVFFCSLCDGCHETFFYSIRRAEMQIAAVFSFLHHRQVSAKHDKSKDSEFACNIKLVISHKLTSHAIHYSLDISYSTAAVDVSCGVGTLLAKYSASNYGR